MVDEQRAVVVLALMLGVLIGMVLGVAWRSRILNPHKKATPARPPIEATLLKQLLAAVRGVVECWENNVAAVNRFRHEMDSSTANAGAGLHASLSAALRELAAEMNTLQGKLAERFQATQNAVSALLPSPAKRVEAENISGQLRGSEQNDSQPDQHLDTQHSRYKAQDLRKEVRHPYRNFQQVAGYKMGHIPERESFKNVQCCDISSSGVSFMATERPESETVVITIGEGEDISYRTARIVAVEQMEGDAGPTFRVGCEFIGRLSKHLF